MFQHFYSIKIATTWNELPNAAELRNFCESDQTNNGQKQGMELLFELTTIIDTYSRTPFKIQRSTNSCRLAFGWKFAQLSSVLLLIY